MYMINESVISPVIPNMGMLILLDCVFFVSQTGLVKFGVVSVIVTLETSVIKQK